MYENYGLPWVYAVLHLFRNKTIKIVFAQTV